MAKKLPWETDQVNEKVEKKFLLRIPEPDHLKLKIIVEYLGYRSMHKFCWELIKERIDEEIDDALKEDKKKFMTVIEDMDL